MKHGDISNIVSSLNIGVRLNDFLIDFKRLNFIQKTLQHVNKKIGQKAIDRSVQKLIECIYYRTSANVDLIFVGKPKNTKNNADKYLKFIQDIDIDIPHNQIHMTHNLYGVETLLYSGVLSYFVTTPFDVEQMSGGYAYGIKQFNQMLKKVKNGAKL